MAQVIPTAEQLAALSKTSFRNYQRTGHYVSDQKEPIDLIIDEFTAITLSLIRSIEPEE